MFNQITNCNNPNEKNQNCVLLKLSDFYSNPHPNQNRNPNRNRNLNRNPNLNPNFNANPNFNFNLNFNL